MKARMAIVVLMVLAGLGAHAVEDATGTWKWNYKNREGKELTATLKLKQEGARLTGTYIAAEGDIDPVADGKIDDAGKMTFSVTRQVRGEPMKFEYSGTLKGDVITGSILFGRPKPTPHEWEAKRVKEEK